MSKIPFNKLLFLLPLLVFVALCSQGQNPMQFSLEEAREHAIEHNKNLVNAGLTVDEADLQLRETIAQGLPQIDATIDYNNYFGSTATLGDMPAFEIEFNPTSNLGVSVSQLIFSGSYIVGIQTARLYKQITEASLEKTELEIKAQVTQSYFLSLVAQKSQDIIEANLENMKGLLEKTKALVEAGVAEEVDYDQLSVQASMLEDASRAAGRQAEMALNMLRLQMGLEADVEIELTDQFKDLISHTDFQATLGESFNFEKNLDYRQVALQTDIAEKQINLERSAYLPTLVGFYNYTEKLLKPEFDMTPNHVIGLNLNIPIFSSGARRARVNQARVNLKVAENQKDLLRQQLLIQEKQLRYNLNNALEQYESQERNLQVARRVFDNINNKYSQGMVSSLDLTTANNNYLQAENSYISSMMQLMEAQIELEKLLNEL